MCIVYSYFSCLISFWEHDTGFCYFFIQRKLRLVWNRLLFGVLWECLHVDDINCWVVYTKRGECFVGYGLLCKCVMQYAFEVELRKRGKLRWIWLNCKNTFVIYFQWESLFSLAFAITPVFLRTDMWRIAHPSGIPMREEERREKENEKRGGSKRIA